MTAPRPSSMDRPLAVASLTPPLKQLTSRPPAVVWRHLDQSRQHTIAQIVADLIRRAYRQPDLTEGCTNEHPESTPDADHRATAGPAGLRVRPPVDLGASRPPRRKHRAPV